MGHVENQLLSCGISEAQVECFEPNSDAIGFYEKLGWTIGRKYFDEMAGVNKVVMQKKIG